MKYQKSIKSITKNCFESLWNMNGAAVADGIDKAHNEISILRYNDENSLSCAINLVILFGQGVLLNSS
mgnify:CR=1 FL=1